eukprot:TRINITY_DN25645_c0_g1_i1.p1 TRINITY_DN25645_c0_g1~~TRINITY_DN25645_c0_g1_i1.p1  ORF type:complete len:461 (-),score=88.36 TRINITY_DN25645_c0_g1_i1:256-1638(-)
MTTSQIMDLIFKLNFDVVFTLRDLLQQLPRFNKIMQPLARISELLESNPKIESPLDASTGIRPATFHGHIEFENVHFAYPTDLRKPILNGLSFTVEPGQKVALIGATGCGKSTSMSILLRLYDVQKGCVKIDGKPIKDYDLPYLRSRISIVDQFTVLFACSVRDNITYGLENVSDEDVEKACREAACWDFLQEKPDKLLTSVSVGGANFSGGQRQRLAIARAIIRKPDVTLLDEATASLDNENERLVQGALDKLARKGSSLVIAHRLSTIKDSDKIVVIDKGVKGEEGTHDELLARSNGSKKDDTNSIDFFPSGGESPAPGPIELDRASTVDGSPNGGELPPPGPIKLKRAATVHEEALSVKHSDEAEGITYKKLWNTSNKKQENLTLTQLESSIEKMTAELEDLKKRAASMKLHSASLRACLKPPKSKYLRSGSAVERAIASLSANNDGLPSVDENSST